MFCCLNTGRDFSVDICLRRFSIQEIIVYLNRMPPHEKQLDTLVHAIRCLGIQIHVIVDAGARDCLESLAFESYFPAASIIAFECAPQNIPICRKNIQGTNIRLVEKALSDREGFMDFHVLGTADRGSSSAFVHKQIPSKTIHVPVTTLQRELTEFPSLLWLDTQGSELAILRGCGERIREISIIHTEVYFKRAYAGQPLYGEIKAYLHSQGFRLFAFTAMTGRFRGVGFGDAIFVNTNLQLGAKPAWLIETSEFVIKPIARKLRRLLPLRRRTY